MPDKSDNYASIIECSLCDKRIWFTDSYSPGDEPMCAECDTEVTGREHPPSLDPEKDPPPGMAPQVMSTALMPLLRLNAPAWFKRQDFMEWINAPGTATWHRKGNTKATDYSDVFFTASVGSGSDWPSGPDSPGIPDDIWFAVERVLLSNYSQYEEVLVWVSNLGE